MMLKFVSRQLLIFSIVISAGLLSTVSAYCQVDDSYGKNTSGLRIGAGFGGTRLFTHYNESPTIRCFIGTFEYEFNPYFSAGFEGQIGTLQGIDNNYPAHLYYSSSTNDYKSISFNLKFGLGLIDHSYPKNGFQDAVKRFYIGIGGGVMKNKISLTIDASLKDAYKNDTKTYGYVPVVPFNLGTFIDLPNVLGRDKIEINPNFQLTYIPSLYSDGFISEPDSHVKGLYSLISVAVKLKF